MHTDRLATARAYSVSTSPGRDRISIALAEHTGFLTADDLAAIAADPLTRLELVLVRCGGCRFLAPAQDVKALITIISNEKSDYVRDVSIPANSQRWL